MSVCRSCGNTLPDNMKFCPKCGSVLDKTAEEKKDEAQKGIPGPLNLNQFWLGTALVLAVILLLILIIHIRNKPKEVDLNSYLEVHFTWEEDRASAEVAFDQQGFEEEVIAILQKNRIIKKKIADILLQRNEYDTFPADEYENVQRGRKILDDIQANFEYGLDKTENLMEGDNVILRISCLNPLMRDYNIRMLCEDVVYTARRMQDGPAGDETDVTEDAVESTSEETVIESTAPAAEETMEAAVQETEAPKEDGEKKKTDSGTAKKEDKAENKEKAADEKNVGDESTVQNEKTASDGEGTEEVPDAKTRSLDELSGKSEFHDIMDRVMNPAEPEESARAPHFNSAAVMMSQARLKKI